MAFKNFNDLVEPLVLPIGDREYTIPPVTIGNGVRYRLFLEGKEEISDDEAFRLFLGPALDQMTADDVPETARLRAFFTAQADFLRGRKVAEMIWETGGDPKAVDRWLGTTPETSTPPQPVTPSPEPDAATTTKRPASTSTTKTSRPKRKPKPKPGS